MKRVRFPIPLSVLVAACTTGCCSFCIRTPGPEFWEGVHEAYSTDRDPAFSVEKFAANSAVDRRVDWLDRWSGYPDLSLLNGARWRARSIRPEDYPDADEISLLEWEETGYWTNGTYATQWTTLSKILTQRGLENNRTFSFSNDDFYGSTTVLVARVHAPGVPPRDIDLAANLAEAVDTGSLASNIHDPNEKTFTLALPGLQVGDAVELSIRRIAKKPRCEGVYSDYLTFESDHPSLLQVVRITGPASMPLRSRAFRDAGPVSLEHAAHTNDLFGTITEVWLAGETPRYFAEPDMPPAYDCTARLLLSTAPDWESLSRWYAKLCAPHLAATNAAMALKVASILRDVVAQDRAADAFDASVLAKLDGIVVPEIEFRNTDVCDVVGDLGACSREFDDEPEASKRGVEFFLDLGGGASTVEDGGRLFENTAESPTSGVPPITIEKTNVSLRDVLDSIVETTGLKWRVENGRVLIVRKDDVRGETFGRWRFAILPGIDGYVSPAGDWKDFLGELGVAWPRGSFVELSGDDGFVVRNTLENLQMIRMVLGAMSVEILRGEPVVLEDAPAPNPDASTRAGDLPPAAQAAVVRALFDFVSREVRYMGAMAESEAPGYEPHDVSLTFDNRYGVCRDKAALLVAMLRMAGIDAWPVLINVGPRKDAQVPQPYFNHAIVAADSGDPDDPYLLMDPTSETTRSLLPEYLCEMSYLVARDEGETIRETPPLPVEENMLRAHTVFTLNEDASADVTTTLTFLGVNDAAYRGYFASIPRDDVRAFFERLLRGVPGAVLTRWELEPAPEDLRKSPEPLVATVEYAIAEAARGAEGGRTALLDLPDLAGALAIASRVVGDLGLEKRRFPLVTDYPCGFEETVELHTPGGVEIASSPDVTYPAPETHAETAEGAEVGGASRPGEPPSPAAVESHAESAE